MNSKQFRELKNKIKNGTAVGKDIVGAVVNEILECIDQGGITKISEVSNCVDVEIQELFGESRRALSAQVMSKLDDKLIVKKA
jgi:hypothetical protein